MITGWRRTVDRIARATLDGAIISCLAGQLAIAAGWILGRPDIEHAGAVLSVLSVGFAFAAALAARWSRA
ncbi:hypothetical protein sos41_11460 [Alphaproteobacteria bacterium SO-S41]|nr:hypothetical protein sos41_11460 [Alphaproteobacteria bacterium SO-S41]